MSSLISSNPRCRNKRHVSTVAQAVERHLRPGKGFNASVFRETSEDLTSFAQAATLGNSASLSSSVEAQAGISNGLDGAFEVPVKAETSLGSHLRSVIRVARRRTDFPMLRLPRLRYAAINGEFNSSATGVSKEEERNAKMDNLRGTSCDVEGGHDVVCGAAKGRKRRRLRDKLDGDEVESTTFSGASSSVEGKRRKGKSKRWCADDERSDATKERNDAADEEPGSPNQISKGEQRRKKKLSLLICPRCKLSLVEWPFCGITGDPHKMEETGLSVEG